MITETEARAVLAQLEEPVTKTDYVTGKMLEKIEVDEEGNVSVAIRLGYPAKSWAQKVGEAVGEALKQAGAATVEVSVRQEIIGHKVQGTTKALPNVKNIIAVSSGKGGVGKSMTSALLACAMARRGYHCGILDADITGPSIPQAFGVHGGAMGGEDFLYANRTRTGIEIMSINLLLPNETDPVVWRGPVIAGAVTQFWTDVQWDNVNYMFVDMPPGTGDVPLTVFQSLPVAGVVVVTSPQELVGMIVDKAVNMADMMHVPVLGIVENMAYYTCPDCGKQHAIFGESHIEAIAAKHGIPNTAKLPIDPAIAAACDAGRIEDVQGDWLSSLADAIEGK